MLAYFLAAFLSQAPAAVQEPVGKWCNPVTANIGGKVTVHCIGVDPRAMDVLNSELEQAASKLDEKIRLANEWVERYKLLEKRLADAGDTSPLSQQVQDLFRAGRFAEAGIILDRILANEQKTLDRLAADHYNRALIFELQFDSQNALAHLEKAYRFAPRSWQYGADYARALGLQNRMVEEEAVYRHFMDLGVKNAKAEDIPYAAIMLTSLARFAVKRRQYEEAEQTYKLALEGLKGLMRVDMSKYFSIWLATVNELGDVYSTLGRYDDADNQYVEALTFEKLLSEGDPGSGFPAMAATMTTIGDLRHEQGKFKEASDAYWKALEYLGQAGGDPARLKPQASEVLLRIGRLALETDYIDAAQTSFETVTKNYREFARQNPGVYQPKLAEALDDLGNLYVHQNEFEQAEKSYTESLEIKQQLAAAMPEVSQAGIAESYNHLAFLYEHFKKLDQASDALEKELKILRQLYGSNNSGYLAPLTQAVNNRAQISMEQKKWEQALKSSTEAVELSKPMVDRQPGIFAEQETKALFVQAASYASLQKPKMAENSYLELLKLSQTQAERDPDGFQATVAQALKFLADFYESQERLDDALQYSQQASDLYRKMRSRSPEFGPDLSGALISQANIMLKRKTDCAQVIPVLQEAEQQTDSLELKQSARRLLQSCAAR